MWLFGLAGHILGYIWARSHPLDFFPSAVKLQSINFGSLLSMNPGARERCHLWRIPFSQRKLQRSSIFKSTLDDIQHFEIMFQLENQMWGAEECSDLFGSVGETFLKSFELKPIESMAYKRQLWMSHCMKMFSINVLLSKLILDSRRSMAFWNLCQN